MSCYRPLQAYYGYLGASGKSQIVFKQPDFDARPLKVPCGRCIGCRLDRSRNWAIRCTHEAEMHDRNCFITLTFSPYALSLRENPWTLDVDDFQRFLKRLRKKFVPKCPFPKKHPMRSAWFQANGIRFFHCGEYGDLNGRPHYHSLIFNFDFPDKYLFKITKSGCRLYRSPALEKLWPYGHSSIGEVTFESSAYVARYCMKKITGAAAEEHYWRVDYNTGEGHILKPEYTTMSRNPGIASSWLDEYLGDVYPKDFVSRRTSKGVFNMRPPRFYDSRYELLYPGDYTVLKDVRQDYMLKRMYCVKDGQTCLKDDFTPLRLEARELYVTMEYQKKAIRPLGFIF